MDLKSPYLPTVTLLINYYGIHITYFKRESTRLLINAKGIKAYGAIRRLLYAQVR